MLPDSAHRQLEALRAAVDARLSTLEAVLADPSRSESLESLVLDLSRLATEEAQASASRACAGMKLEADTELSRARTTSQVALDQERAVSQDLRRIVEQSRQQIAALERSTSILEAAVADAKRQSESARANGAEAAARVAEMTARLERDQEKSRATHEALTADLAQERNRAADLQEKQARAQADLDAERAITGGLRAAAQRAEEQLAAMSREQAETRTAQEGLKAELFQERMRASGLQDRQADAQKRLQAERTTNAELRAAVERATERVAAVSHTGTETQTALDAAVAELAGERKLAADLLRAHAEVRSQLDHERTATAELRDAVKQGERELARVAAEQTRALTGREEARQELTSARTEIETLSAEVAVLRADLDTSRARLTARDHGSETDRAAELEAAAAELANERKLAADLLRAHADVKTQLDHERTVTAELRKAAKRSEEQAARLAGEQARAQESREGLRQELAGSRGQIETLRAEMEVMRADLDAARARLKARDEGENASVAAALEAAGAELANERKLAADLMGAHAEVRSQLDAERALTAQLRNAARQAEQQLAEVGAEQVRAQEGRDEVRQELAAARADIEALRAELETSRARLGAAEGNQDSNALAVLEATAAELAGEREAAAKLRRAHADVKTHLDRERALTGNLRRTIEQSEQRLTIVASERAHAHTRYDEVQRELVAARAEADTLRADLEASRAGLDMRTEQQDGEAQTALEETGRKLAYERQVSADLRRAHAEAETQLETERALTKELRGALQRSSKQPGRHYGAEPPPRSSHSEPRQTLSSTRPEVRTPRVELEPAPTGNLKPAPTAIQEPAGRDPGVEAAEKLEEEQRKLRRPQEGAYALPAFASEAAAEEGWEPIRLATRYAFSERLPIHVNGTQAYLCDLSATGCQILSTAPLKPKQVIKLMLASAPLLACTGKVVWAQLEGAATGLQPGYRAGVQFTKADEEALERFIALQTVKT